MFTWREFFKKYGLSFTAALFFFLCLQTGFTVAGCRDDGDRKPHSASGVRKLTTKVATNENGHTVEQENIARRLAMDNTPGAIKHLYVQSAMTGDVLIYSTVKGKVTSSGKRLTPVTVSTSRGDFGAGFPVDFDGDSQYTGEVLQDDGTYGSSIEYLYWWDVQGRYRQHYVTGGQIVHISDQPLAVKKVKINMDLEGAPPEQESAPAPATSTSTPASKH